MLDRFRNFLNPPYFEEPDKNTQAKNLNVILLSAFLLTFLYFLYTIFVPHPGQLIVAIIALGLEVLTFYISWTRRTRLASFLLSTVLWLAIVIEEIMYGGVRDSGFAAFSIVIIIAGLTLGWGGSIVYTVLAIIAGIALIYAENINLLTPASDVSSVSILLSHSITFISILLLIYLVLRNLTLASRKTFTDEQVTRTMNFQLEQSRSELTQLSLLLEEHDRALQAISEIDNQINNNVAIDEQEFLKHISLIIRTHFRVDRVRVFLLDEVGEYLILQASDPSEDKGIQIWVNRSGSSYRDQTDSASIQVGKGIFSFNLPKAEDNIITNSIYPITTGSQFLGVLNVLSSKTEPGEVYKSSLQTAANQIAFAVENLRLSSRIRSYVEETNVLTRQSTRDAWKKVQGGTQIGFHYDRIRVMEGFEEYPPNTIAQLIDGKSVVYVPSGSPRVSKLIAPILLRNQMIGSIGYEEEDPNYIWEKDRIIVLESVAAQVSMALENTRLIAESQQLAQQEQLISEVTSRMRETLDIDSILQTAIQDIRRSFKLEEAEIRLQPSSPIENVTEKREQ
jgi:GAF domain-containing protein